MSTNWTLPTNAIIKDALELLGIIGAGDPISAEDSDIALTAFQNILKEMPIHGFVWQKVTSDKVALTWSSGTPSKVNMPSDYFGVPNISFTQNSANVDLEVITKAAYDELVQPDYVAQYPKQIYVSANNIGYLWPVPSQDPQLKITYQAITTDALLQSTPDIAQSFISGFGVWLAYELFPKFPSVDQVTIAEIKERYPIKKKMMLEWSAESAPIRFTVDD